MKKAVITITSGRFFQRMADITHPTIKAYADKIGGDFIVWNDHTGHVLPHYKKMELGNLLDEYDRVLYVDTDVLIREDAPDIFAVVPENELGMLKESPFVDHTADMMQFMISLRHKPDQWDRNYYNSGVMVLSKVHRNLFVQPMIERDSFKEQTYLNVLISEKKIKVFPLPHRFNRVFVIDWACGEDRLDCYFLHYAGMTTLMSEGELLRLIRAEHAAWEQKKPNYVFRNHIAFILQGGLGEQIAAESSLRYARDVIYQNENIVIVSSHPELYRHLNLPIYSTPELIPYGSKFHARRLEKAPDKTPRELIARHQIHAANLASLNLLGLELPPAYKTPKLPVNPEALARVVEKVRPRDIDRLVLLHPGRGLAPNTFPADVWQSYADVLVHGGWQVAVIGKRIDPARGIVEIDTSKCLDLIDRLSLEELIAIVSQARVLISNDSAPVQIAGAFDRWIGLIATLRHPEYVLPWRNGSQFWRAGNLERIAMYGDYHQRPSRLEPPLLDQCTEARLRECLGEPRTILEFVAAAFEDRDGRDRPARH